MQIARPDPLEYEPGRTEEYERAAAFGLSHVLFEKSPGGVLSAAERTARFRDLVDKAVSGSGIDADTVEAIVLLESAGRQDVIAGDDPENASGLTQILAETATNFLGMPVDLEESRRLTDLLQEAVRRGDDAEADQLRSMRRRVDARFDPEQALAGTVRYLMEAKKVLGRDDLAVVSYHMGIGNLTSVVRAYTGQQDEAIDTVVRDEGIDYARLYFDSSPIGHRAPGATASFGDDSQTYYWRVLAALGVMHLFRSDPAGSSCSPSSRPAAERRARPSSALSGRPLRGQRTAPSRCPAWRPRPPIRWWRHSPRDRSAARENRGPLSENPSTYVALRPRAARLLAYLAQVYELSGEERPLAVTRATYDEEVAVTLISRDSGAAADAGVHATGFAFDVRRRYGSGEQAAAFQWTLERLEALGLIAWARGRSVIHLVVSPRADVS